MSQDVFSTVQSSTVDQLRRDFTVVAYHGRCPDGLCARWVAERVLGPDVKYLPVSHGDVLPSFAGQRVLFVDFAPTRESLIRIREEAEYVVVLDHHHTAQQRISDIPNVFFAEKESGNSGASMAWEFFNPGVPFPFIIECVRSCDTYNWPTPEAKALSIMFMGWFNIQPYNLGLYEKFLNPSPGEIAHVLELGKTVQETENEMFRRLSSSAKSITVQGRPALIVNASANRSLMGNYLLDNNKDIEIAVTYSYSDNNDECSFSLRARPESDIDLTKTATLFGVGGGHKTASGFKIQGQYQPDLILPIIA